MIRRISHDQAHKNQQTPRQFLDVLFAERGLVEKVKTAGIKRVIAMEIADMMRKRHISKTEMAKSRHASRAMID